MLRYQEPPAKFSAAMTRKKAAHPQALYARQMMPAAAATAPPTMRAAPQKPMWRYSHGLIRRCRPGRGGFRHQARKPLPAVLSLGSFMAIASCGRGVGSPDHLINVISQ